MPAIEFADIIKRAKLIHDSQEDLADFRKNEAKEQTELEKNDDKNKELFMKEQQIILDGLSSGNSFNVRLDTIEFQLADNEYPSEKFIASIVSLGYNFLDYNISRSKTKTIVFGVREDIIYHNDPENINMLIGEMKQKL